MNKFFSLLIFLISTSLSAQTLIESPYSRYGLGEINNNTDPHFFSMGGTSIGFRSPLLINQANPASYTAFDSLSFLFNGGFTGQFSEQKNQTNKSYPTTLSFNSFSFGFRITNFWGTAIGLQPYSSVGYDMTSSGILDSSTTYSEKYSGNGGLNKLWWGNAFKPFHNFSIGFNSAFIFGSINRERKIAFDSTSFLNTKSSIKRHIKDFCFDAGAQYEIKLKDDTSSLNKDIKLIIGGTFGIPSKLNASETSLTERFYYYNNLEYNLDTINQTSGIKGSVSMPAYYGLGLTIGNFKNWTVGADIRFQNWSSYSAFGENDSLKNSMAINMGGSFTPNASTVAKYFQKVTYIFGFHHDKTYLQLKGTQLNRTGISFGMVFPLQTSYINASAIKVGVEVGKIGSTENNLIEEKYIKFVFGISIKEQWFVKRKYN